MDFQDTSTEKLSLDLANGRCVQVEVASTGRSDVAFDRHAFNEVTETISGIIDEIAVVIHKNLPTKATVKFGVNINVDSGKLTALIVKGSGNANLEISLEWDRTADIQSNSNSEVKPQ